MTAFPGESGEYRAARDEFLLQEIDFAGTWRPSPSPSGVAARRHHSRNCGFDEIDQDGGITQVSLSELLAAGTTSLAVYNYMFLRHSHDRRPCPDRARRPAKPPPCRWRRARVIMHGPDRSAGRSGTHIAPHANLVVVANTPIKRLGTFGRERGRRHIRLLSSAGNSFARDYSGESTSEHQPMMNVFHRDNSTIRQFWGSELLYAPTEPHQDPRHLGTIESFWTCST